jgi:hypothetical protein
MGLEKGRRHIMLELLLFFIPVIVLHAVTFSAGPLYKTGFAGDPTKSGWEYLPPEGRKGEPTFGEGAIVADAGAKWVSPEIPCTPFHYYQLRFRSRAESNGFYAVFYYAKDGEFIVADTYGSVYTSNEWMDTAVMYRGREAAVVARVAFIGIGGAVQVDHVSVEEVDTEAVAKWSDDMYASVPPLHYVPSPDRWRFIPATMKRLRQGGELRFVMLGDSIINDTNNSNFEVLLERMYPRAGIKVIASVRGSTGCWYYKEPEHFQEYVIDRRPDLLFIGGTSHRNNMDAIREVITMAREKLDCEIILASGPVGVDWREHDEDHPERPLPEMDYTPANDEGANLAALAREMNVEYFDMATPWHEYLAASKKPFMWFHRDHVHANDRGKQVLARIIERYFSAE